MRSFAIVAVLGVSHRCSSRNGLLSRLYACGGACLPRPEPLLVTKPQTLTFTALGTSAAQTLIITLPSQQNAAPSETDNCTQATIRVVNVSSPTTPQGGTSMVTVTPESNGSCTLTFSGKSGVGPAMVPVRVATP